MSLSDESLAGASEAIAATTDSPSLNRWEGPEFAPGLDHSSVAPGISVSQLEALQQQAYDESYAVGLQEGRQAGESASKAEAQRFSQLLSHLARPFEDLDDAVEKQVVQLALIVARSVIRRELKTDPSHVIGAVRDALAALPISARDVQVRLHPDDATLVRKHLIPAHKEVAWVIKEDPVLTRGGCRVDAEHSHVDARVESRMASMVAAVINDDRATDSDFAARNRDTAQDSSDATPQLNSSATQSD